MQYIFLPFLIQHGDVVTMSGYAVHGLTIYCQHVDDVDVSVHWGMKIITLCMFLLSFIQHGEGVAVSVHWRIKVTTLCMA